MIRGQTEKENKGFRYDIRQMNAKTKRNRFVEWGLIALTIAIMTAVPLLVFTGCGSDSLSSSQQSQGTVVGSYFDLTYDGEFFDADQPALARRNSSDGYDSGEKIISAEDGGKISLSGGGHVFVVQAGSIEEDTRITVAMKFEFHENTNIALFNFGPDGLQFDPAASLTFRSKELEDPTRPVKLYWLNPDDDRWVFVTSVSADADGMVTLPIEHFSGYGISNTRSRR